MRSRSMTASQRTIRACLFKFASSWCYVIVDPRTLLPCSFLVHVPNWTAPPPVPAEKSNRSNINFPRLILNSNWGRRVLQERKGIMTLVVKPSLLQQFRNALIVQSCLRVRFGELGYFEKKVLEKSVLTKVNEEAIVLILLLMAYAVWREC